MNDLRQCSTIFIIDDDASVRDSLSLVLSLQGFRTATFVSAESFLEFVKPDSAGCVITDLKMPGMSGLELQQELAVSNPALPIIFVTAHGDIRSARMAFKSAAIDFLEKPFDDAQIVAAIEPALAQLHSAQQSLDQRKQREGAFASLTAREKDVMELLGQGLRIREIAEELELSPRTIEVYKARVLEKLGIRNVAELVRLLTSNT